jgi:hypothetical protein
MRIAILSIVGLTGLCESGTSARIAIEKMRITAMSRHINLILKAKS